MLAEINGGPPLYGLKMNQKDVDFETRQD